MFHGGCSPALHGYSAAHETGSRHIPACAAVQCGVCVVCGRYASAISASAHSHSPNSLCVVNMDDVCVNVCVDVFSVCVDDIFGVCVCVSVVCIDDMFASVVCVDTVCVSVVCIDVVFVFSSDDVCSCVHSLPSERCLICALFPQLCPASTFSHFSFLSIFFRCTLSAVFAASAECAASPADPKNGTENTPERKISLSLAEQQCSDEEAVPELSAPSSLHPSKNTLRVRIKLFSSSVHQC